MKQGINWAGYVYVLLPLVLVLIAGFVGFVKFMAWWRVAFGDCSP